MAKPIPLDAEQAAYLESLVAAGRDSSVDETVLEGLGLLQAREPHLANLRDAWREGVDSGDYEAVGMVLDDIEVRYALRVDASA